MCRSITEWAPAFIYDEYLQRTMTLKKPIIAPSLGCKMGHLSHNLLWRQFHRKTLWMFDSKPMPSAFWQDSTLTQYKNAAFRKAAHARNLLINSMPEHFLWWMELVSKLLLTNLSQNDYELFFFSNWLNISAVQYKPVEYTYTSISTVLETLYNILATGVHLNLGRTANGELLNGNDGMASSSNSC